MSLYSERVAQDSPLFYFENNSSGVNNTGSITPTIVTGSSTAFTSTGGVQNGPYMVNAARTGEYGFEYSNSSTIFDDRVFSITGWFKVASTDISTNPDWIFHAGTTANGIYLQKTDKLYLGTQFNTVAVNTTTAPSFDAWHHVAVTMDTTNLKLYLDGTLIATASSPSTLSIDSLVKYWTRATTSGTTRNGVKGNFDEWAVFNTTLSSTTISEHFNAGFGVDFHATAVTASALAVNPTISAIRNVNFTGTALTASAASGDHYNSTRDNFTLLDGYMGTLSLEQWYKFDDEKNIINYGSGGGAAFYFTGNATSTDHGGIQGSGALKICGNDSDGAVFITLDDYTTMSPELTDGDFSVGFWVKAPSSVASNPAVVWVASNYNDGTFTGFIIHNSGKLEFQMYTNTMHSIQTASSICDNNWHLAVGKYNSSTNTMSFYFDNTLIGTETVNSSQFSSPNLVAFGSNNQSANGNFFSLSNFFISSSASITTTVMGNMITYSVPKELQAYANMEPVKLSFNNSFNNLTEERGALVDLRFNEASGSPINYGTTTGINLAVTGDAVTYGQLSPNTKAYKITDTNAKISSVVTYPTGTFTTDNEQTLMVYAKVDTGTEPAVINIFATAGHFGGPYGAGLGVYMMGSGAIRARFRDENGSNTINSSGTYADSQYHLYTVTTDGSTVKLYIDGKLEGSVATTKTLTDYGLLMIGGEADTFGVTDDPKSTYIDEVSVYNSAFSAEQVFNHFQALSWAMDWTATASLPAPTVSAGTGRTINATALTATALMSVVFPPIAPATGQALFQNPNYEAIKNTSNSVTVWTASAMAENPGWNIGEENQVLHMDASADMPDAKALIPGRWNASPMIANPARMVEPAFSSTRGARIIAQSIPVKAAFVTPPAYKLITDDIWYQKLYLQHSILNGERFKTDNLPGTTGTSSASAFLKLFDDVTQSLNGSNTNKIINNLPRSIVIDTPENTSTETQYATATNAFQTASPLPLLEVGTYDNFERKSVRFRNIQFEIPENNYVSDRSYSLEFTFKSTKSDQVIAQGFQRSFLYNQSATSSIGLIDGKLFASRATQKIGGSRVFAHPDNEKLAYAMVTAYGNKRIDDGLWHHIIIQYGLDNRVQFWIDGQLDIQFFPDSNYVYGATIRPYTIGSNHSNPRWQSDFETSAWSYDAAFFVDSDDVTEHYTASIKYEPIHAEPATAAAEIGQGAKAEGNRPRALMLYFWPTSSAQTKTPFGTSAFTSEGPDELTTLDYFTAPPQEYEGWDVFPVDVTGYWVSDLVKKESYGVENIRSTNFIEFVTPYGRPEQAPIALYNARRTFRDPLTDAPRYIDLINDIDLSKFDMIMFKNYPNDPNEKDSFSGAEVVDSYFNLRESKIFEDFVKSLRSAIDTGLSLYVENPQLALDLKIVDRIETIPDMDDNIGQGNYSDPYAPTQMSDVEGAADLPVPPTYPEPLGWKDTWKNNRSRIVNTHPGITDYAGLIKTQFAYWTSSDEYRWGGADRQFAKYEHKNSLSVGDEFVISSANQNGTSTKSGYQAAPFANVKAGKIITAFANTLRRGLDQIENPYKNHAQSIIVEPGDVLDGRQVGGKIFVNFTEPIRQTYDSGSVELTSVYWINYAYENGAISETQKNDLLTQDFVTEETPYWSINGMHLLQQKGAEYELDTDFNKEGLQKKSAKVRKVNKNGGISFQSVPSGSVFFSSTYSWQYPMASFEVPSMPTKGFRWLSNREILEGTVIRPTALEATAQMPNALGVPDKVNNFNAQSMVATATLEETTYSSGTKRIAVLPATATATIVKPGSTIGVPPMTANAGMFINSRAKVASEDQVTLYLIHVDPILYIREDVIK